MARLRLAAGCGSCSLFGVLPAIPHTARPSAQRHQERLPRLTLPAHVAFAWTLLRAVFLDGPPKSPGGVWAALAAPGYQIISKSPKNKKRSRCESAFGFPLLSFKGLRRVARWALFVLASRFASPPYLAPGSGLCGAWPFGGLPPGGLYLVRLPCPHPGCCAAFTALLAFAPTATFYIPLPHAVHCVYRAVLAQEPGRPARSLGAHRGLCAAMDEI